MYVPSHEMTLAYNRLKKALNGGNENTVPAPLKQFVDAITEENRIHANAFYYIASTMSDVIHRLSKKRLFFAMKDLREILANHGQFSGIRFWGDGDKSSLAMDAVTSGDVERVDFFCSIFGADLFNECFREVTENPFIAAFGKDGIEPSVEVLEKTARIIKLLLDAGLRPSQWDNKMLLAVASKITEVKKPELIPPYIEIARMILESADMDKDDHDTLHKAILTVCEYSKKNMENVPETYDSTVDSVTNAAVREFVELLVQHGAGFNDNASLGQTTSPLLHIMQNMTFGYADEYSAPILKADAFARTMVFLGLPKREKRSSNGRYNIDTTILRDNHENGVLHYAVKYIHPDLCRVYLSKGALMHSNLFGQTPLHIMPWGHLTAPGKGKERRRAPLKAYGEIVRMLTEHGNPLNTPERNGRTVLESVSDCLNIVMKHSDIVADKAEANAILEYLVSRGARAEYTPGKFADAIKSMNSYICEAMLRDSPEVSLPQTLVRDSFFRDMPLVTMNDGKCESGRFLFDLFEPGSKAAANGDSFRILKLLVEHGVSPISPHDPDGSRIVDILVCIHDADSLDFLAKRFPETIAPGKELLSLVFDDLDSGRILQTVKVLTKHFAAHILGNTTCPARDRILSDCTDALRGIGDIRASGKGCKEELSKCARELEKLIKHVYSFDYVANASVHSDDFLSPEGRDDSPCDFGLLSGR